MLSYLSAWLKQPTTVAGIATLAGTLAGAINGSVSLPMAITLVTGGFVAMVMPDNTQAKMQAQTTAQDLIALVQSLQKPESK